MPRGLKLQIVAPLASEEEAAAVAAALERFVRDNASKTVLKRPSPATVSVSPWKRAALEEAVGRRLEPPAPWL